jgi:hypothetical protein
LRIRSRASSSPSLITRGKIVAIDLMADPEHLGELDLAVLND